MKKVFLFTLLTITFWKVSPAQIKKGSWMIDGALLLAQPTDEAVHSSIQDKQLTGIWATASPKMGYFVSNRLAIGGQFAFLGASIAATTDPWHFNIQEYRLKPFARYYLTPRKWVKIFYELELDGGSRLEQFTDFAPEPFENQRSTYNFSVINKLGANIFLADNVAWEGTLSNEMYRWIKNTPVFGVFQNKNYFPFRSLGLTFTMRLFLNTARQTPAVLAKKYLKEGNFAYGLHARVGNSYDDNEFKMIQPFVNYFVSDNLVIGTALEYYNQPITLKPEIRYYHALTPATQAIIRATASIRNTNKDRPNPWSESTIQIGVGLNRFIADNISIEGLLNVHTIALSQNKTYKSTLTIGFQYFMSKK